MVYVASPRSSEMGETTEEPLIGDDEVSACWERLGVKITDSLNLNQFALAMDELGFQWSLNEAKQIFKTMDTDKNKEISYTEFKSALNHELPAFSKFWGFLMHPPENNAGDDAEEEETQLTIDDMIQLLKSTQSDWKMRTKAMHQLKELIEHMGDEDFKDLMKDLCPAFQIQLGERRSVIIKEVCVCLVDIDKAQSALFSPYVPELFPALFQCVRMNVQVISKSGMMACANIVRNTKEDAELSVLRACLLGFEEPHSIVREVCFTYIGTIFEINDLDAQSDDFWNLIFEGLQGGVNDSDSKARTQCYNAIKIMKQKKEEKYKEFFESLAKAEQKRVMRALGIKQMRKKLKRKKLKKKAVNKRVEEIGGSVTVDETSPPATNTPLALMTPMSKEDAIERESLLQSQQRISLAANKKRAASNDILPDPTGDLKKQDDEVIVPLKKDSGDGHMLTMDTDTDHSEVIDWRKQSDPAYTGENVHSPRIGETYYFLNVLGYKQKAIVRDKDGDNLTVEWLPNDRRYSHTGVDVRNIDEPSHVTQDMIESSTRSMDDEGTTGCACIIS